MENNDQTTQSNPTPNETDQAPPHAPEEILALCHELAEALSRPDYSSAVLQRQAHLLDQLVYSVMNKHHKHEQTRSYFSGDLIELTLRIQKQCVETLKAMEAIEYMKTLSGRATRAPSPHPLKIGKRTEGR